MGRLGAAVVVVASDTNLTFDTGVDPRFGWSARVAGCVTMLTSSESLEVSRRDQRMELSLSVVDFVVPEFISFGCSIGGFLLEWSFDVSTVSVGCRTVGLTWRHKSSVLTDGDPGGKFSRLEIKRQVNPSGGSEAGSQTPWTSVAR